MSGDIYDNGDDDWEPFRHKPGAMVQMDGDGKLEVLEMFTAEKALYSRVYAAERSKEGGDSHGANLTAQAAVSNMMKFFNELQEKQ